MLPRDLLALLLSVQIPTVGNVEPETRYSWSVLHVEIGAVYSTPNVRFFGGSPTADPDASLAQSQQLEVRPCHVGPGRPGPRTSPRT